MPVAARRIDPDVLSRERFMEWIKTQPEGAHHEFDGVRAVMMAPATVDHNRIGKNIRETVGARLPAVMRCEVFGPQQPIDTVGGAVREPDAFIACSSPHGKSVIVAAPVVVFEVVSPGPENRKRDEEEKADEYESVPTILRYIVVESEFRGFRVFWREPGERAWRRDPPRTDGPIVLPEFGITMTLDEVYAKVVFD